ncbi:MAG: hypothetical protein WAW06_07905 [bacterium]
MPFWRLIAYRLKIALSWLTRGSARKRVGRLVALAGVAFTIVVLAVGAYEIFGALRTLGPTGAVASAAVVTFTFHGILVLAFLFDIATTANIFYLSSDLGLLLAAPLPTIKVFALKYVEAMAAGSFMAVFLALPVVVGYGAAFGAPAVFYVALAVVMALFLTIPVSVGTLCGMVISRFIRAARVREVLGVLSGVIGLGVWIGFQVLKPSTASVAQMEDLSARMTRLAEGGGSAMALLPSRFPAEVLTSLVSPSKWSALEPLAYLVAVAAVMLAVSIVVAERIYLTGWTRTSAPAGRSARRRAGKVPTRAVGGGLAAPWRWLPQAERSIFATTWRLLLRDPQQITPIATLTLMMTLFPFFLGRSGGAAGTRPMLLMYSAAMLAFTGSMNLATSAVLIHGRSFWHILAAPAAPMKKLAAAGFAVPLSCFLALPAALLAVAGLTGMLAWPFALKAAVLAAGFAALGSSMGVFLGIWLGNWEWDTPKRMLKTGGRLVMVGAVLAVLALMGLAMGAFGHAGVAGAKSGIAWSGLAGAATISVGLAYLLLVASAARMNRMEWTD